ncbi:low molecular weight protein-tyrosine-phosphatase [Alkanindiges sp. WGS2144]|uniref:low molecular weight protein-tyrosine-phosphatase n=1 Tax=Alkanindiges sp. WGS2144 TaxID=3366808 RepID=UPI00375146DE
MASSSYRVLCVCLGNICRSPTAEIILKHYIKAAGLPIELDSAGTSNYHPGKAPDPRTQAHAKARGYDLSALRARQVSAEDFESFDLILAMDQQNLADLQDLQRKFQAGNSKKYKAQLALMSQHDALYPQQAVPDPYYGGATDFEHVIHQCESAAQGWINYWQAHLKQENSQQASVAPVTKKALETP